MECMQFLITKSQKKLITIFIAIYYLLFFLFGYFTYNPGGCGLYMNGDLGYVIMAFSESGRLPCSLVEAGVLAFEPLYFNNSFYFIGLFIWVIEISVYSLLFLAVYQVILFIQKKRKTKRNTFYHASKIK